MEVTKPGKCVQELALGMVCHEGLAKYPNDCNMKINNSRVGSMVCHEGLVTYPDNLQHEDQQSKVADPAKMGHR